MKAMLLITILFTLGFSAAARAESDEMTRYFKLAKTGERFAIIQKEIAGTPAYFLKRATSDRPEKLMKNHLNDCNAEFRTVKAEIFWVQSGKCESRHKFDGLVTTSRGSSYSAVEIK